MGEILTEGTITYYSHFKITIMKVYNITNRISTQARQELTNIIDTHEKYKNSYFFHPSPNAAGRRYNENRFKEAHPKVSFLKGESTVTVIMMYEESCKNVYYKMTVVIKNGREESLGNIATIKGLLK